AFVVKFPTYSTVSTACVTCAGVWVNPLGGRKRPTAEKILENAAESPASSARFVSPLFADQQPSL
ncbi:MAG TPA: hypothetical protein PLG52_12040, partial [Anaerolineales bacterium]|nr:hypothetical protein [Anaerolineales bacterium]